LGVPGLSHNGGMDILGPFPVAAGQKKVVDRGC